MWKCSFILFLTSAEEEIYMPLQAVVDPVWSQLRGWKIVPWKHKIIPDQLHNQNQILINTIAPKTKHDIPIISWYPMISPYSWVYTFDFFLVKWPFLPCHHPSHEKIKIPMIWSWPAHETIWNTMKSPPNPRGNGVHSAWASRMPGHSWKHWRSRLVRPLAFGIHHGFGLNTLMELIELIESIESIANRFIVIACYS